MFVDSGFEGVDISGVGDVIQTATPPFRVLLWFLSWVARVCSQWHFMRRSRKDDCCGLHVCVLPNLNVKILTSHVMILRGVDIRRWRGYEGSVFMNGVNGLIKHTQRALSALAHVRTSEKTTVWNLEEGPGRVAPGSQTPSLQNCGGCISVVYKPPSVLLCYSSPS